MFVYSVMCVTVYQFPWILRQVTEDQRKVGGAQLQSLQVSNHMFVYSVMCVTVYQFPWILRQVTEDQWKVGGARLQPLQVSNHMFVYSVMCVTVSMDTTAGGRGPMEGGRGLTAVSTG